MGSIEVGTCGYQYYDPGDGWKSEFDSKLAAYSHTFPVVELNRTFYNLPQVKTAERWRREVADEFQFTLKAWQAITHPWSSPTWNNNREDIPQEMTDDVGYFKPTSAVYQAWKETSAIADAVEAQIVLIQTPPSFDCCEKHERNMREVLRTIDRGGHTLAWEPRGDWSEYPARVAELCQELDLLHVIDIMRDDPLIDNNVLYTRLHGLNEEKYDYDYDYTNDELEHLAHHLETHSQQRDSVYCLFNNFAMYSNATRLLREYL